MISYPEPEQVKAYRDLIPIGPLSVAELVEKLRARLDIEEIGEKDITAGQMNAARFNAFHCVYNQKAIWKPEEMSFVLYKIVQNEKSRAYYDEPDLSWGIDGFIHVLFEEKTGFYASNSQRLSIEIGLARGVSKESIETEDYSFRGILAHLAIAEWEGRKIDPFVSDRSGRLKMIGQDRRNEGVMKSYPEQVEAYRDLIPIGPLSVAELVEKLKSRLDIEEIGEKDITAGQMNAARFNAFHCDR